MNLRVLETQVVNTENDIPLVFYFFTEEPLFTMNMWKIGLVAVFYDAIQTSNKEVLHKKCTGIQKRIT